MDYGATARGYESVSAALIWSIEQELGDAFDVALRDAWRELIGVVAGVRHRAGEKRRRAG
ncbi:MAG TPA: hypothetical protein VNZ57_02725 [Longimicrobiales bacterium]|nr:hypothetical protein [Longimicrobiales bacterium]